MGFYSAGDSDDDDEPDEPPTEAELVRRHGSWAVRRAML
jgi:hypothetical protein